MRSGALDLVHNRAVIIQLFGPNRALGPNGVRCVGGWRPSARLWPRWEWLMPDPGARGVPSIQPPNYVSIPLWMPLVVTGVFTARSWRSHRARTTAADRARTGACPRCGYAREGLAPAAPCPECALVPPPSPLPTAPPVSPPEPS